VQWWKRPGADMGRHRAQYLYRCPHHSCRGQVVEPAVLPAAAAIDWALPGTRIGDRAVPLKPKTIARIEAGLRKYAIPVSVQTGGPDRYPGSRTRQVSEPPATCTTTTTPARALAGAPLMVPAGGTWRDEATPVTDPLPARTARENDGLAVPPFVTIHRGGPAPPGPRRCPSQQVNRHGGGTMKAPRYVRGAFTWGCDPRLPQLSGALTALSPAPSQLTETIEFPVVHPTEKRLPLVRREPQDQALSVLTVADTYLAARQVRHLHAVAVGET
jgi:hypothetical protein